MLLPSAASLLPPLQVDPGGLLWRSLLDPLGYRRDLSCAELVLPLIICGALSSQHYPDEVWLAHTARKDPSNWTFMDKDSHLKCKKWLNEIDLKDWQVNKTEWKEIYFNSTNGLRLQGFFLPAQNGLTTGVGPANQAPTIIQVHGHGPYAAQQSQMIPAKGFQEQGFNVFLFNNQGLGKSEKPPAEYGIRTFGADGLTNTAGAIEFVTTNPEGTLPYATPLNKGFYAESGTNGMISGSTLREPMASVGGRASRTSSWTAPPRRPGTKGSTTTTIRMPSMATFTTRQVAKCS